MPYVVLVVDDDDLIRLLMPKMIKTVFDKIFALEVEVVTAKTGGEALSCLESCQLLLTDFSMEEMNGLELIRTAQKINPKIKSILISGYEMIEEALLGGADTALQKPVSPEILAEAIRQLLLS